MMKQKLQTLLKQALTALVDEGVLESVPEIVHAFIKGF
jgi:hypothetical protein